MSRGLRPPMVHLTDQVLAALRGVDMMATPDVARAVGRDPNRPDTWRALDWLARTGLVERVEVRYGAAAFWRRVEPGEPLPELRLTVDGEGPAMPDRRGPATVRLCDQALAVLSESARPLSTAEVAQAVGVPPIGTEAYRALLWLEAPWPRRQPAPTPHRHPHLVLAHPQPTQQRGEQPWLNTAASSGPVRR